MAHLAELRLDLLMLFLQHVKLTSQCGDLQRALLMCQGNNRHDTTAFRVILTSRAAGPLAQLSPGAALHTTGELSCQENCATEMTLVTHRELILRRCVRS